MSERQAMKTPESSTPQAQRDPDAVLLPPVDICEDATGITLRADLPGVSRDRLTIEVDKNTLVIEGQAAIDMPEGMAPLYADVRATRYRRSFTLSRELETDKVEAQLNDGVLTLRVPKQPELQPRKIKVSIG